MMASVFYWICKGISIIQKMLDFKIMGIFLPIFSPQASKNGLF